jgi:hypothetical protein|uniref:Uncharacterized protein n=1 Tax=viral metagenome TaxID=1070528 RepID=A0A6C0JNC4_9ZZZZ
MSDSTENNSIYKFLVQKLNEFIRIANNFDKTPLFKIFEFIINIYKEDKNTPEGFCIIIIFILKLLFAIVFLILPIVLTFYSIIILLNISTKSVKYGWLEDKYNYQNNKYDYIRKLFKITKYLVFSERIFIYLISSILFMVLLVAFYLFNYCKDNKEGKGKNTTSKPYFDYLINNSVDFMKLLRVNISLFSLLLFILIFYYSIYFNDYKDVYESNKRINEIYYEYLDKDYIREICNNFRDDKNNINSKCYLDKLPTDGYLLDYINRKTLSFTADEKVDFDNLNPNDNTKTAFIILKSLITHQFLINKYNNRFIQKYEYDSCKSIDIDLIMSKENKLSNLFVCFKETTNHPFNINIINVLKQYKTNAGAAADKITDQAIGKIYEKYLSINNELSRHISTISKSKLNETILQIIISIVFIIYLVIFFYLFWT